MSEQSRKLADTLLRKATVDLHMAEAAIERRDETEPWACTFHAQQAVEKVLKATLVRRGIDSQRTHDLGLLMARLPATEPFPLARSDAEWLSDFAVAGRYAFEDPAVGSDPDWRDAERALTIARMVLAAVRGRADDEPGDK